MTCRKLKLTVAVIVVAMLGRTLAWLPVAYRTAVQEGQARISIVVVEQKFVAHVDCLRGDKDQER